MKISDRVVFWETNMEVLLILSILIAPFSFAETLNDDNRKQDNVNNEEDFGERVKIVPATLKKNPWLTPGEGILGCQLTGIYTAYSEENSGVSFREIPNAMKDIIENLLNNEKYQKANVENINNPNNDALISIVPESTTKNWPEFLYPKLIVIVAHDIYQMYNKDLSEVIPYILAFWNGVDTLFRSIENPKIRLNIANIVLETEYGVFDYAKSDPRNDKGLLPNVFWKAASFWYKYKKHLPIDNDDIIVTMTNRGICVNTPERDCNPRIIGQSYPNSACNAIPVPFRLNGIILRDNGRFSGVVSGAHELGHTLGIDHDQVMASKPEADLEELPSCKDVGAGYIMNDAGKANSVMTAYKQRWSQCSLRQLEISIKKQKAACLYDPPVVGEIHIPRLLPGKLITLDDYCKAHGYGGVCPQQNKPCEVIFCLNFDDPTRCIGDNSFTSAEGTPCDENDPKKFCFLGECVSETEFT